MQKYMRFLLGVVGLLLTLLPATAQASGPGDGIPSPPADPQIVAALKAVSAHQI